MDLSKPIAYNGLSVNTLTASLPTGQALSGYMVASVDLSNVGVDRFMERKALQDGMNASDVFLGARVVTMVVNVYGNSAGDFWDRHQALLAAFHPHAAYINDTTNLGFSALTFYQPTAQTASWPTGTYPDGIPMQMYLRPMATGAYSVERPKAQATGGLSMPVTLRLEARDPRKYAQTALSYTVGTSTTAGVYRGDYPTYPIFTATITSAGSSAFQLSYAMQSNGSSGTTMAIDLSSVSSGTIVIDTGQRSIVDGDGTRRVGLLQSGFWLPFSPGYSSSKVANATGISSVTVSYREAWA